MLLGSCQGITRFVMQLQGSLMMFNNIKRRPCTWEKYFEYINLQNKNIIVRQKVQSRLQLVELFVFVLHPLLTIEITKELFHDSTLSIRFKNLLFHFLWGMLIICTYVTQICPFEHLFIGCKSIQYKSNTNQYWTRKLEIKL